MHAGSFFLDVSVTKRWLGTPDDLGHHIGNLVDVLIIHVVRHIILTVRTSEMRALDTGDGQRAQAHIHRRMGVRIHIRHIDGADFVMEIAGNLLNELHDALIALESSGIAFGCEHCDLTGADALEVNQKNAAQLIAMSLKERLETGVAALGGASGNKPNVMAKQLIITHGGDSVAKLKLSYAVDTRRAALPAVIIAVEVVPRANFAAAALSVEVIIDPKPLAHAFLLLLLATKYAAQAAALLLGLRCGSLDGLEGLLFLYGSRSRRGLGR